MQASNPSPPTPPAPNTRKPHACSLCNQRKVRCDRLPTGCTNCTKARVACLYKLPVAPRRRKRPLGEVDLLARVRKYEEILAGLGVKVEFEGGTLVSFDDGSGAGDQLTPHPAAAASSGGRKDEVEKVAREFGDVKLDASNVSMRGVDVASAEARLVGSGGSTRYLSNHLWTNLTEVGWECLFCDEWFVCLLIVPGPRRRRDLAGVFGRRRGRSVCRVLPHRPSRTPSPYQPHRCQLKRPPSIPSTHLQALADVSGKRESPHKGGAHSYFAAVYSQSSRSSGWCFQGI